MADNKTKLTFKDFKSKGDVKWCPGCGDHAILVSVQKAMADMNYKHEKFVSISGIGCSSRFPFYVNTYGFHTIHGRAGAIASGAKVANPRLSVWQITGDGDSLAIGGNHFIHEIRRNMDINIIMFNNQIYGLTKGQYSPTSPKGQVSVTSPYGTVEKPFQAGALVIGARGTFFARSMDNKVNLTAEVLEEAAKHDGASVVEVLQNCVIYNNGAHAYFSDKEHKEDRQLILHDGEPMIFGKERDKGLILDDSKLKVVKIGEDGITKDDILIHNAGLEYSGIHLMLATMEPPFPIALGVIRNVDDYTYANELAQQIKDVQAESKIKCVDDLLLSGKTWEVK
ncbi:MAG: 2-oxoacid:ferredoxin oxidoreductase subunit beta [Bacteroidetes bacterium]|nr:MAG: 2-oxoacid:ferredoxin oxidoreductase subunit beta [Bacteroidota bacterium]